jgi:hypothetical protein
MAQVCFYKITYVALCVDLKLTHSKHGKLACDSIETHSLYENNRSIVQTPNRIHHQLARSACLL